MSQVEQLLREEARVGNPVEPGGDVKENCTGCPCADGESHIGGGARFGDEERTGAQYEQWRGWPAWASCGWASCGWVELPRPWKRPSRERKQERGLCSEYPEGAAPRVNVGEDAADEWSQQ